MNTFELELLSAYDEESVAARVVEFVRCRRRLPGYSDLLVTGQGEDARSEAPVVQL